MYKRHTPGKKSYVLHLYSQDKYTLKEISVISKTNIKSVEYWIKQYKYKKNGFKPYNRMLTRSVNNRQNGFSNWVDNIFNKSNDNCL